MNLIYKAISILFIIILTASAISAGGGWPQPKGKAYIKLSEWWVISDQHFTDIGRIDPNVTLAIYNTSLYAEYGITNRLTGIVYAPLFSRATVNNVVSGTTQEVLIEGDAINGLGDADISLKYGLTGGGGPLVLAVTATLGLPLGQASGGRDNNLQTGDGEMNQMFRLDGSTSFQLGTGINSYVSAYGAYNNRVNGFSDELRYGLEAGLGLMSGKLWLVGRADVVDSRKNGDPANQTLPTSIFANNSEFTSLAIDVAYKVTDKWGISAGVANAVSGRIILASPSYNVGVFIDLK